MFIVTIIAQPGVFLDTLSQRAAACLDKTDMITDNYKISKCLCHESNTQKTVPGLGTIELEHDLFSF